MATQPRHWSVRLRNAALFVAASLAVVAGLYPSLFTIGALIALPSAVAALAGVVAPSVMRRRWLRWLAGAGAVVLALESILVLGELTLRPRRRPVMLLLRSPAPTRVRIVYDVTDGAPRGARRERRFDVPGDGVVHTQHAKDRGLYRRGEPYPVRAVIVRSDGRRDTVPAAWAAGGGAPIGTCPVEYDEFIVGDSARTLRRSDYPASTWLDSLSSWGVTCRDGRVVRASAGVAP